MIRVSDSVKGFGLDAPFSRPGQSELVRKVNGPAERNLRNDANSYPPVAPSPLRDAVLQANRAAVAPSIDPLDVEYDGVTLRKLVEIDEHRQHEWIDGAIITPVQRAAISAHWSAELQAKVAASAERERCRVLVEVDDG